MPAERRGQVIAVEIGSTGNGRNPTINGGRQPSCGDTSRMNREVNVRICERLGVKLPGATRPAHPTAEWLANQLTEACDWEQIPRYLVRDRDRAYGESAGFGRSAFETARRLFAHLGKTATQSG